MASVTITKDLVFYEKGFKRTVYKKGQVVDPASADLIAHMQAESEVPAAKPTAPSTGGLFKKP